MPAINPMDELPPATGTPVVSPGANPPVEAAAASVVDPAIPAPPPAIKSYTKRPITVQAVQFDGTRDEVLAAWCGGTLKEMVDNTWGIDIETIEGTMTAIAGWFIIQGVEGEFYPVKPSIFATSYDLKG